MKPEFWQSESNSRLSRDARLFFVALFNLADNEGRFRAHPAFLAGQAFPFDHDGVKAAMACMEELTRAGKVQTYISDDSLFGVVINFAKHQKVDPRFPSKLPVPPKLSDVTPKLSDSTPIHPAGTGNREQGSGTGNREQGARAAEPDPEPLRSLWNETTTPPLPRCETLGDKPKSPRRVAAVEALKRRDLEGWRRVFKFINASPFLRGANGGWKADFDWAIRAEGKKPEPATKVLEGAYAAGAGPPKGAAWHDQTPDTGKSFLEGLEG